MDQSPSYNAKLLSYTNEPKDRWPLSLETRNQGLFGTFKFQGPLKTFFPN